MTEQAANSTLDSNTITGKAITVQEIQPKPSKKSAYELWMGLKEFFQQKYIRVNNSNQMARFWKDAARFTTYKDGSGLRNRANDTIFKWIKIKLDSQGHNNTGGTAPCYVDVIKSKKDEVTEQQAFDLVSFYCDICGTNGKKFDKMSNKNQENYKKIHVKNKLYQ